MNDLDELDERGGYRPPEPGMGFDYDELTEIVAKAVSEENKFRTLPQIKKFAALPAAFDLTPILNGMIFDKQLRRHENGQITAYFPYSSEVKRFWLSGSGTVDAEYVRSAEQVIRKTDTEKPETPNGPVLRKVKDIDLERLEHLAATLPNAREVCNALDISVSYFYRQKENKAVSDAWDRGREAYRSLHPETPVGKRTRPVPTHPIGNRRPVQKIQPELDPKYVEELASQGLTAKEAAEKLGLTLYVFKNRLASLRAGNKTGNWPEIREAWYRGVERSKKSGLRGKSRKPQADRVGEADEPLPRSIDDEREPAGTTEKSLIKLNRDSDTLSEKGISTSHQELPVGIPQIFDGSLEFLDLRSPSTPLDVRRIELAGGAKLEIGFDGNFFDLDRDDRELLGFVAELIQGYPKGVRIQERRADSKREASPNKTGIWEKVRRIFR